MNRSASAHLSKYPNARSSTLAHLIVFERKTEELRREVRAKRNPILRLLRALRGPVRS
jgi:hypothetical protein